MKKLLLHRHHLADVVKPFKEGLVGLGYLHVVSGLLTEPDAGVDAERCLEQEGVLCRYGPLAVQYLPVYYRLMLQRYVFLPVFTRK